MSQALYTEKVHMSRMSIIHGHWDHLHTLIAPMSLGLRHPRQTELAGFRFASRGNDVSHVVVPSHSSHVGMG